MLVTLRSLLLLSVLGFQTQCTSMSGAEVNACIERQITEFEGGDVDFAAAKAAHGLIAVQSSSQQFTFQSSSECQLEVTYVQEGGGNRVGGIYLKLGTPTSLAELSKKFGSFKHLPPTPAKKWSALANYDTEAEGQTYAIIAEARHEIKDNTPIERVTIRIDYED